MRGVTFEPVGKRAERPDAPVDPVSAALERLGSELPAGPKVASFAQLLDRLGDAASVERALDQMLAAAGKLESPTAVASLTEALRTTATARLGALRDAGAAQSAFHPETPPAPPTAAPSTPVPTRAASLQWQVTDVNVTRSEHTVPGTLPGAKPVRLDATWRAAGGDVRSTLLVTLHGSHSAGSRYADVDEAFAGTGVSVGRITTSRLADFAPGTDPSFTDFARRSFAGKTYAMELEDFRRGIRALLAEAPGRLGVAPENVQLVLLGSSLGATMAAQLSAEFGKQLKQLVLAAPPTRANDPESRSLPLLDTFPTQRVAFFDPLVAFEGDVVVVHGTRDTVVPAEQARAFGAAAIRAKSVKYISVDAGHTFSEARGEFLSRVRDAVVG